jgi:hypothetical protein
MPSRDTTWTKSPELLIDVQEHQSNYLSDFTEKLHIHAKFEVFTVVKIQVEVFWVVMPCSIMVGYKRFRGPSWLYTYMPFLPVPLTSP